MFIDTNILDYINNLDDKQRNAIAEKLVTTSNALWELADELQNLNFNLYESKTMHWMEKLHNICESDQDYYINLFCIFDCNKNSVKESSDLHMKGCKDDC